MILEITRTKCQLHVRATSTIIILICCLPFTISGQTVSISYGPDGSSQPTEDEINYRLDCIISNLDVSNNPALVWSKDGGILFWSRGTPTDLDMTGDYEIRESTDTSPSITHFILTITQVAMRHSGEYKCLIAIGDVTTLKYTELIFAQVYIQVLTSITIPDGIYFPSDKWPQCFSQNKVTARIHTDFTVRCSSVPGNPTVALELFANGSYINESVGHFATNLIQRTYTFTVTPHINNIRFSCHIIGALDGPSAERTGTCVFPPIRVGLFLYDAVEIHEGTDAILICNHGTVNAMHWSTDPPIIRSRLIIEDNTPTILRIMQVKLNENGTRVICSVGGFNLQDQLLLIVIPSNQPISILPTTVSPEYGSSPSYIMSTSKRLAATSTTSPFDSTSITFTTQSTTSGGLPITLIAAIGGGGGLLVLAISCCIIAICCCCRCRNRESDIKFEDGTSTRISTGYMWDKELSHMVHESPRPSPKLTNNNHAHVRQALKDPDEIDPSMSSSLAYALANHSDDDLDSYDGNLKKPVSAAYETVDLNPAGRVLEHGAGVHSNLYTSTAIVSPNHPMSSNTSADFPPKYAVPDKNKYPSSKADYDATPTESPYAIVHPDPENPRVRASLRQRTTEGHVNAAYDPNEEGFVENDIYEPAGI